MRPGIPIAVALGMLGGCAAVPQARPQVQPVPPSTRAAPPTVQADRPAGPVTFSYSGPRMQGGTVIGIAPAGTQTLTLDGAAVKVAPVAGAKVAAAVRAAVAAVVVVVAVRADSAVAVTAVVAVATIAVVAPARTTAAKS